MSEFRSGFVALMGSPNTGKSTLLNRLVGEKVTIVSPKAQTTRNKITGIVTTDYYQLVILDTPGIHVPRTKLGKYMNDQAYSANRDVDLTVMMIDAVVGIKEQDISNIKALLSPFFFAAINKIDCVNEQKIQLLVEKLVDLNVPRKSVFPISALNGTGVRELTDAIVAELEPGPKYYPDDMITDRPERFIASEIIREKALYCLSQEVPHGIGVEIEKMVPEGDLVRIEAVIFCERESQKSIIIGRNGSMLKKIGTLSRHDIESLLGSKVFLGLYVKAKKDWRNSARMLQELGYTRGD